MTIVQRQSTGEFLIIKGEETGLLANLWDFPQLIVPINQVAQHKALMNAYLGPLVDQQVSRYQLEKSIVHQFSHIHRTMHIEHLIISEQQAAKKIRLDDTKQETYLVKTHDWVNRDQLLKLAIPMTLKKCLKALDSQPKVKGKPVRQTKLSFPKVTKSK